MTKYLIITLTLLFIPTNAVASNSNSELTEYCGVVEMLATKIMTARQNAASMSRLMEIFPGPSAVEDMGRKMIKDAYEEPHWQSYDLKQTTISNFANKWAGICYAKEGK